MFFSSLTEKNAKDCFRENIHFFDENSTAPIPCHNKKKIFYRIRSALYVYGEYGVYVSVCAQKKNKKKKKKGIRRE